MSAPKMILPQYLLPSKNPFKMLNYSFYVHVCSLYIFLVNILFISLLSIYYFTYDNTCTLQCGPLRNFVLQIGGVLELF